MESYMTNPKPIYCERCESARKVVQDHYDISAKLLAENKLMRAKIRGFERRFKYILESARAGADVIEEMTNEELFGTVGK